MATRLLNRKIAWPADHGTWAFFLSPLIIGLVAGRTWSHASLYLVVAASCGFLLRQPITCLVKILSGRRARKDLIPSLLWSALYLAIAMLHLLGLYLRGFGFVLVLAVPGVIVFCWYLILIAKRDERRQKGVEIVGAGVLALSAAAAYWIGIEWQSPRGWTLWLLCWALSAMSIIHVYARLEQRGSGDIGLTQLREPARRALFVNSGLFLVVAAATFFMDLPDAIFAPYLVQWMDTFAASNARRPAPRPTLIGLRQVLVTTLFTVLFLIVWR